MIFKTAKTIGLNTDQQASQTYLLNIDQQNLFIEVLDLTSDDAFTGGRQLLVDLGDQFLEEDGTPAQKLEKVFSEVKDKLKDAEKYSILLATISGKVLYLIGQGEVLVYLHRQEKFSHLLKDGTGQLISGFLQPGDRVLFYTKSLEKYLGGTLKKSFNLSLDDWEEEITSRIISPETVVPDTEIIDGMAGLLLQVQDEKEQIIEKTKEAETEIEIPKTAEVIEGPKVRLPIKLKSNPLTPVLNLMKSVLILLLAKKWARVVLVLVILVILGGVVGTQILRNNSKAKTAQINSLLTEAKDNFNGGNGLLTLNPGEAANKYALAKAKLDEALKLDPKNPELLAFKATLDQSLTSGNAGVKAEFTTFLDLKLIKEGFSATSLSLSTGKIAVLDQKNNSLALIDIAKKSQNILAGKDQLGSPKATSLNGSNVFVYSTDKGILSLDTGNSKVTAVSKSDSEWGNITDLYSFGSNIYLLDAGKNQIWKYLPTSSGYSDKRAYLTADSKADLSGGIKLQIESSVYVLKQSGQILRFTKGDADNFSYAKLDKNVSSPKSFFVSSDTDNLYLLDSGNSRLLVLSKSGEYVSQYQGDKFANATDLVVDEAGKKVYLLSDNVIYQIDLK